MPSEAGEIVAVRQEIVSLLRQQLEALNSPEGLTDIMLMECYERQARVQELREKLQAVSNAEHRNYSTLSNAVMSSQVDQVPPARWMVPPVCKARRNQD